MSTRRQYILDSAIGVLGMAGPRGLTHRAVDRELALPLGSTANVFGRRQELLDGIVERLEERDRVEWEQLHRGTLAPSTEVLARRLAAFVHRSIDEPMATTQKARYYLQLELPNQTGRAGERLAQEVGELIEAAGGGTDRGRITMATLDGLMIRAVTYGHDGVPPQGEIAAALQRLMDRD